MDNIFLILFFLSLIAIPISLFKPTLFTKIFRKEFTKKQLGLIFTGTAVLFFVLFGVTAPKAEQKNSPTTAQENNKNQETSPIQEPTKETLAASSFKVVRVIDGDTLVASINGADQTIRLIGIDTPETVDPRKPVQCFGKQASDKAKEILSGKSIILESDSSQGEKDKYDRLLRYVFLEDGTNFNKFMIEQGFAHEYTYNTPYKYQADFKKAEQEARDGKRGLWADSACPVQTNPTPNPSPTPTPTSTAHVDKDCSDFKTHNEAQAYFLAGGGSPSYNYDKLDSDGDGIACESLP